MEDPPYPYAQANGWDFLPSTANVANKSVIFRTVSCKMLLIRDIFYYISWYIWRIWKGKEPQRDIYVSVEVRCRRLENLLFEEYKNLVQKSWQIPHVVIIQDHWILWGTFSAKKVGIASRKMNLKDCPYSGKNKLCRITNRGHSYAPVIFH